MRGADWRHPQGPDSSINGLDDHPVVHVAYRDAQAYAGWADKVIPTEAEWEYAARGGLEGAEFPWGDEPMSGGSYRANFWQGQFPWQNLASDGYEGTSPIGVFPPNGYGLFDVVGNTWEWTSDWYQPHHPVDMQKACCIPHNPRGGAKRDSFDPRQPKIRIPRKVLKGGSHLCAQGYCYRYRPAADLRTGRYSDVPRRLPLYHPGTGLIFSTSLMGFDGWSRSPSVNARGDPADGG